MRTVRYINIANGIELLDDKLLGPEFGVLKSEVRFIRIQSTWCEQHHWSRLVEGVSDDLLLNLALGNMCIVYDTSRKNTKPSKALRMGIRFISWCCLRLWYNTEYLYHEGLALKDDGLDRYFQRTYNNLSRTAKRKLKYYRKFVDKDRVGFLLPSCKKTEHDGDYNYFVNKLREWHNG